VYDFGATSQVTSVTGTFTFHNDGDGMLELKKPAPSCGCTVASVKPETLKPGEKGELVFTVNIGTVATRTSLHKSITVPSNDPKNGSIALAISADIVPLFEVSPPGVSLGELSVGAATNASAHIKRVDGKKIEFTKVDSTGPWIHPKLVMPDGAAGSEADIRIEATSDGQPGAFTYMVRAFTDNPTTPAIQIPVSGRLIGDIGVTPEAVYWGIADPEHWPGPAAEIQTTRKIRVVSGKSNVALEVKNVSTSLTNLAVSLEPVQTGKVYQVVAKLAEAPKASMTGEITFDTNIPSQPKVKVPVTISVIKR
jgi:uncharacterized protein DUF1573